MVVCSKPALDTFSLINDFKPTTFVSGIPVIDLSKPDAKILVVKACEEFGFFKVINHRVPIEFIQKLESEAVKFFSLPLPQKEEAGPANPFGYGNKRIGPNGDIGWIEYILLRSNPQFISERSLSIFGESPEVFCSAANDYISSVRMMTCEILELLAEGLGIEQRNVFSKLLMEEESDCLFRINHYPPCPNVQPLSHPNIIGFGEHTDPQIISVLHSNNISGLEISLRDGTWVPVPPDQSSFFINVGDSLQVLTNGRFKSVKHRVLTNGLKSRVSMIYFGGPPLDEKIAPLPTLIEEGEESLYKEFTWCEYKKSVYKSRLADNRLLHFQKLRAAADGLQSPDHILKY
ncbi:gibberellin 2-beta-dioxygenase 1-like [Telopea speciosissima]|uniref:gibberellin 2-beta-dioxygenase 1-like n=1 Tax=Telopea speciosissima TaxID=54955 RepID=UPI001CC72532|nr:gibberellin 2-beta-dioxygenase 1-like [Telopea speciosissima]